jgi:hypothetical protein
MLVRRVDVCTATVHKSTRRPRSSVVGMSEHSTSDAFTEPAAPTEPAPALDLDRIEGDLADVEVALARLDSGEYWRDEVSGQPLDDALLAEHPTARRAADTIR